MVVVLVVATVVAQVLIAVLKPAEAEQIDERDRVIALRGDRVAGWIVTIGALAGLGLAMIEADSFWIAHALVAGLVLAEIFKAIAMLVNYRRSL
jgi:fatty acid desaturase